ncbi:MAG: hypothetical protein ACRD0P_30410, partial [Stackebrandtia sp.]
RSTERVWAAIVSISHGMLAGFAHLWRRRGTMYVMTAQAGHRALYGVLTVFTLATFRGHFHNPVDYPDFGDTLGWLAGIAAAGQVGSFVAAVVTPRASRLLSPGRWVGLLMAAVTVTVAAIGFHVVPWIFVAGVAVVNVASQGTKIVVDTSLQINCDDEYRGRLFSLNDTVFNLSFIIGMFAGATVLPADGYTPWLVFATAGGYVLLTVWYFFTASRYAPYGRVRDASV